MKTYRYIMLALGLLAAPYLRAHADVVVDVRTELDRPVLPAGDTERAVVKIRLLPEQRQSRQDRPPLNLAIALDRSGSMSGSRIEQAREGALVALRMLDKRDRFALVAYGSEVETLIPTQHPQRPERLAQVIRGINASGMTALYGGVAEAANELRRGSTAGSVDRLILLSDGRANVGPASPQDLRMLGHELASDGIVISTIGLGAGYNEDLMTALAETGQGNAYFAEGPEDLQRIFAAELEDLLSLAATDIRVTIRCAPGVRPVASIGRQGKIQGSEVSFEIRQLFGGQERFALLEVEVPAGREGDVRDLLSVEVDYRDALSGRNVRHEDQAQVSYSAREEKVREAANVEVVRSVADNRIAEARLEAIALSDAGRPAEASASMRQVNEEVSTMSRLYRDSRLRQQADAIDAEALRLQSAPLGNIERKAWVEDSYRTMNQQRSLE